MPWCRARRAGDRRRHHGRPGRRDPGQARRRGPTRARMLRRLSARTHRVHTGVARRGCGDDVRSEVVTSLVTFTPLTPADHRLVRRPPANRSTRPAPTPSRARAACSCCACAAASATSSACRCTPSLASRPTWARRWWARSSRGLPPRPTRRRWPRGRSRRVERGVRSPSPATSTRRPPSHHSTVRAVDAAERSGALGEADGSTTVHGAFLRRRRR